jgi:ABC-type siderophore export system fused ATPase/permease subunit
MFITKSDAISEHFVVGSVAQGIDKVSEWNLLDLFLDPMILTCCNFAFSALLSARMVHLTLVPFPASIVAALTQDFPDFRAAFGLRPLPLVACMLNFSSPTDCR